MNPTNLLLIDTSEHACHVALYGVDVASGQYEVLHVASQIQPRQHADILLPLIDSVFSHCGLSAASLDAIAVVNGPGAFTGLRIGLAMTQGLAFGWGVPCIQVNTLELWARSAFAQHSDWSNVTCLLDARMSQVYAASYRQLTSGEIEELCAPCCIAPADLDISLLIKKMNDPSLSSLQFIGSGVKPYAALLKTMAQDLSVAMIESDVKLCFKSFGASALSAYQRGDVVSPRDLDAYYLRPAVASKE